MKILITNDDGIYSEGIIMVAQQLAQKHEVTVVAPDRERSAVSSALTMDLPLRKKKVSIKDYDGIDAYAITGTPVDCVKMALKHITGEVDLVVSGINRGGNLGTDIVYSGTVAAAIDACMAGIPAIAVSQKFNHKASADIKDLFACSSSLFATMIEQMDLSLLCNYIYNINFPSMRKEDIKGIKVCSQGVATYSEDYRKEVDPFGREHFWLCGDLLHNEHNDRNQTDIKWIAEGYITLTPLTWNTTMHGAMSDTKCNIGKIKLHNP